MTSYNEITSLIPLSGVIVVTSDLGRVTTNFSAILSIPYNCGDVRSRTSYNYSLQSVNIADAIVVTSDLGRVTTPLVTFQPRTGEIVVTSDLGRVTTSLSLAAPTTSALW